MAVTPELVAACSLCFRKAFLMARGDQAEPPHEYVAVIERIAEQCRDQFLGSLDDKETGRYAQAELNWNAAGIIGAEIVSGDLSAHVQVLLRRDTGRSTVKGEFEPH